MKGKQRICEVDMAVSNRKSLDEQITVSTWHCAECHCCIYRQVHRKWKHEQFSKEINLNQSENSSSSFINNTADIKMDSKCSENKRH